MTSNASATNSDDTWRVTQKSRHGYTMTRTYPTWFDAYRSLVLWENYGQGCVITEITTPDKENIEHP